MRNETVDLPNLDIELLPRTLRSLITTLEEPLEQQALLMAVITVVGAALPGVKTRYLGKLYAPALYYFVVGLPGSGKSVIEPAVRLGKLIDKSLKEQGLCEIRAFNASHLAWEQGGKSGDEPTKPTRKCFILAADSTAPLLIRQICTLKSALIFDTEADSLAMALRAEYGDVSGALRKAWHGEPITHARVTGDLFVETDNPHLGIVVSGTPDQISVLARHVESGLTSRIRFTWFPPQRKFKFPFDPRSDEVMKQIEVGARTVHELWRHVSEQTLTETVLVELTSGQQQDLYLHFKRIIDDREDDSDSGTTLRSGIVAVRIMIVLTVMRCWDERKDISGTLMVNNDDFQVGMALAEHLRLQSEYVVKNYLKRGSSAFTSRNEKNHRIWYDHLPDEFTTSTAIAAGEKCGFKKSTVHTLLASYGGITKVSHACYRKDRSNSVRDP